MTDNGLEMTASTDSEDVSAFGIQLEMTFLENDYGDIYVHLLPTSPYTSADGRFMFCIFTRLNGKYFVAAAADASKCVSF